MTLTHDERFHYKGFHGSPSVCRLRVYEEVGQPPIALMSELPDNPGTSITNAAEHLAGVIWMRLEEPWPGMVWIEHHEECANVGGQPTLQEHFDQVTFRAQTDASGSLIGFTQPCWQPLSKEEVEEVIGRPIEPTRQLA